MKVMRFYNGSDFFTQEVPWFEWDIEGAKYLMSGAAEAYSILGSSIADNDEKKYAKFKAVFDLVHKLQVRFNYLDGKHKIQQRVNKGYKKYWEVLDQIITNLAAALFLLNSASMTEDEAEKAYYGEKIMDYGMEAYRRLGELKEGKINMTMRDGKTRIFDYRYSTSNELDYRGMLFYGKDTRDMKDFKGEVERKIFKR
ncbi:MAG: hypothetical protein J6Y78_03125 [Paludibacteraceae bacterium]|nr:hypothetical protein [Methanobrevibacter sp.]MBP5421415.1 hypothetical protein [Paludibacteraceae bacterium]